MDKLKKILHAILFPPFPANVITAGISFALVAVVLILRLQSPLAYAAYLLSAYGLYILIAALLVPSIKNIRQRLGKIPLIDRYFSDKQFSARISLYQGAAFNIIYALFKFIMGIVFGSFWFIAIAIYYIFLILIKAPLVRTDVRGLHAEQETLKEWKSYRFVGWLMMLINLGLSGIIIQVIWKGNSFSYPGSIIFIMALYAFYRIIIVIVKLIRDRKIHTPVFLASKAIDFTVAVVAMFTLQTAMLTSFAKGDYYIMALFNSITGIAVTAIVLGVAIYMIIRGTVNIKRIHSEGTNEQQ